MNRIILIGNGFDLAHGLPTSYESFINDFWKQKIQKHREHQHQDFYDDEDIISDTSNPYSTFVDCFPEDMTPTYASFMETGDKHGIISNVKSKLLGRISSHYEDLGWSGIENDYYKELKEVAKTEDNLKGKALELNKELDSIKKYLRIYLKNAESKTVISPEIISEIIKKVYSPLRMKDISEVYRGKIIGLIKDELNLIFEGLKNSESSEDIAIDTITSKYTRLKYLLKNDSKYKCNKQDIIDALREWANKKTHKELINYMDIHVKSTKNKIFTELLYPKDVLFLDFNYTDTSFRYKEYDPDSDTDIIHIHGELDNSKNPMIFGYGDEIGEDYKKIEDLEENELLKNVKSIRYQDTNNYQRLMEFIESDYYQVFVMGHSCGNSDRTLLNTLFEHENCLSIKPYYYQYGEKEEDNDYSNIVRNISRNFRDKPAMRNKVVNKTYCEPLLDYKPKSKK